MVLLVYLGKAERNRDVVRETGCLDVLCGELKSPHSVRKDPVPLSASC